MAAEDSAAGGNDPTRWQREDVIDDVVRDNGTVAVVGLSPRTDRPSHQVARYLQNQGIRIIPVNPNATEVLGETSYPSLHDVPENIDVVDVFRRPEFTPEIARQAVDVGARTLWMQVGVVNQEAAEIAEQGGLHAVMDRCLMVEHGKRNR